MACDWVGVVYLFQWLLSPTAEVEVLVTVLVAGVLDLEELDEPDPSFLPLRPLIMKLSITTCLSKVSSYHRLFMLKLIGFRSFLSCPPLPSAAILASISAFFLSINEA